MKKNEELEKAQDYAKAKGGQCLSDDYKNMKEPLDWKCNKGHVWKASAGHIVGKSSWCPICASKKGK